LLQTSNQHRFGPLHPFRCVARDADTTVFLARTLPITGLAALREFPDKKGFRQTYGRSEFARNSICGNFLRYEG
jgi:hypothetical protein